MSGSVACFLLTPTGRDNADGRALWSRSDDGPECTLADAPPGAMWDATWWPGDKGPDGRTLVVRLPDGSDWLVDGPSAHRDGSPQANPGWTRTGEPPRITARPSIGKYATDGTFRYHGFLTDGVLVPC